jgi:hypothetical protein
MSEGVVYAIASVFVLVGLAANVRFVYRYARYSDWSGNPVGRTHMIRALSMGSILLYAFGSRWLPLPEVVQHLLGLAVWATVAFVEVRIAAVLEAIQRGNISVEDRNWTPIRDWLHKRVRRR